MFNDEGLGQAMGESAQDGKIKKLEKRLDKLEKSMAIFPDKASPPTGYKLNVCYPQLSQD